MNPEQEKPSSGENREDMLETRQSKFLSNDQVISIYHWISKMKSLESLKDRQKKRKAKHALRFRYKIVGSGRHRIVYDLRNGYVIKVAISRRGLKNNKTEFKLYTRCSSNLRKYLCPVAEYGYGWVVMKRMKPLDGLNEEYDKKLSRIKRKFLRKGIDPHDLKCENLAYSKHIKRIIVIDYGGFR